MSIRNVMHPPKLGKKEGILIAAVLVLIIASAFILSPQNVDKPEVEYPPEVDEGEPPTTISHTILAEMFISRYCENCTYSEEALHNLDADEDKLIAVVHLVDEINGARGRYEEAKNGTFFPDVEFDGGYRSLLGNATYRDYRNKTMECMTRPVIWVDLNTTITTSSTGYKAVIKGSLAGGSTEGVLRVYLVEKESKEYMAYGGKPIHNLVVDYLYEKNIVLKTTERTEIEVPINYVESVDNLAVVAAFYVPNGHSVQAVMTDFP